MDQKITTYTTLWNLVEADENDHELKDMARLLLEAMSDWPRAEQNNIANFLNEFKGYFGQALTIKMIQAKKFDGHNAWQLEAGAAIQEILDIAAKHGRESDFDKIIAHILNHYNEVFRAVDFIAELSYRTSAQGGRSTPAKSGYRPAVKFDFDEMQTSGQQTFIGKDTVFPGETVDAKIKIIASDYFAGCLTEGMIFEFKEGPKVIGTGIIKQIINDKLELNKL
ncbi:hypothetical protein HQN84_13960 [Pedobacter steynii]|nr:hypothetical protein [Pedobacter steynii]NQX39956.1 hypothetical protein [Pedobacter steynii]